MSLKHKVAIAQSHNVSHLYNAEEEEMKSLLDHVRLYMLPISSNAQGVEVKIKMLSSTRDNVTLRVHILMFSA